MELGSPDAMARFADDVRQQEEPFIATAQAEFRQLFAAEYRRLRAIALESGENTAVLNVAVRCNFAATSRSVEIVSAPAPVQHKQRRRAAKVTRTG